MPDEDFDTAGLDRMSREFLSDAIVDYNVHFSTNFSTDDLLLAPEKKAGVIEKPKAFFATFMGLLDV